MKFLLYGVSQQKGNSRQIVTNKRTGKPMVIKSSKALKAADDFISQLQVQKQSEALEGLIHLDIVFYYPNNRHDLDDSLICDCLQKAGIIKNDRQIVEKILIKYIDRKNPRVFIYIAELSNYKLEV